MKHTKILANIKFIPIYIVFIPFWGTAAVGKLLGGGVPPQFTEMFSKTFIGTFPGSTFSFYMIAVFELTATVLFALSLLRREFLQNKTKPFLNWAMFTTMFNFSILGFGLRVANNNEMATQLFFYFAAAGLIWLFVDRD